MPIIPNSGHLINRTFARLKFVAFIIVFAAQIFVSAASYAQTSPVEKIEKDAQDVQITISILDRLSSATEMDDEALVGARVKYQNAISSASDVIHSIDEQSKSIADRLTEIGAPPENGVVEAKTVTDTRAQLNADKSKLAVIKTNLEKSVLRAQEAIDEITTARQAAFTDAIAKRTNITTDMLSEAVGGVSSLFATATTNFTGWFAFVGQNKFWPAIGSALASLVTALLLSFNLNRFFGGYLHRNDETPDYFTRVFVGFWASVLPSLATVIFLAVTYTLFSELNIFTVKIANFTLELFLVIAGLVFAWHFCRALFAPDRSQWRILNFPDKSATHMFWLTLALIFIYALDSLFSTLNATFSGALSLTVLQGVIAAILIGIILILMARVFLRRKRNTPATILNENEGEEVTSPSLPLFKWDKWIAAALIISAVIIIASAVLGYIGFARFFAQQIVVTGGILAIMAVGILAARELSREGVLAATRFGRGLIAKGYEPYRLEQFSLAGGLTLIAVTLLIGIPAIFMQWGTRFEEITAFASRVFTGVDIGNFRISLSGILIGLFIFAIILVITRLIQRWLARSVFPRSKIDPGVSDSIGAGLGYVGFAIAALLAVTSAGFDLSSLAIVAGALSLGIGFGLQNIVSNFVSGLILLVERPIKVGDWIVVGGAEGFVKRISVRATEIETFQKQSIIVPNSELINSQVSNWTFKTKNGRCDILIGIAYGSDVRLAESILYEIAHNHAMVQKKPEPRVWFLDFGASSLDFRLQMYLYDITNVAIVGTEVRFEILKRFEEAGIEIPFPQQDVNLRLMSDSDKEKLSKMQKKPSSRTTKPAARKSKPSPNADSRKAQLPD